MTADSGWLKFSAWPGLPPSRITATIRPVDAPPYLPLVPELREHLGEEHTQTIDMRAAGGHDVRCACGADLTDYYVRDGGLLRARRVEA